MGSRSRRRGLRKRTDCGRVRGLPEEAGVRLFPSNPHAPVPVGKPVKHRQARTRARTHTPTHPAQQRKPLRKVSSVTGPPPLVTPRSPGVSGATHDDLIPLGCTRSSIGIPCELLPIRPDQDERAWPAHRTVPETTSRDQGSGLSGSAMIPQIDCGGGPDACSLSTVSPHSRESGLGLGGGIGRGGSGRSDGGGGGGSRWGDLGWGGGGGIGRGGFREERWGGGSRWGDLGWGGGGHRTRSVAPPRGQKRWVTLAGIG